jgi:hypothetical protein
MIWRIIQCLLVVLLAGLGVAAPHIGSILKLEPPSTGALTGALIGSAAAMLGALLTSLNTGADKKSSEAARRNAIKALITAELVNVAAGYISLQRMVRAARGTISAGGPIPMPIDLSSDAPRSMPFTVGLGTELLILSPEEIDVLSTLESNATVTRGEIQRLSTSEGSFGYLAITALCQGVAHDMDVLAQAFERLAPARKLKTDDQPPEPSAAALRTLSAELVKPN